MDSKTVSRITTIVLFTVIAAKSLFTLATFNAAAPVESLDWDEDEKEADSAELSN